jgi:hypothetical protein
MRSRQSSIERLREAIDTLPMYTRVAMLAGVRSNDIIVGAYTDRRGGVCPMLAAHRNGGRTSYISFAHAWDGFARAKRVRRATERELAILESHLEASILADETVDLNAAIDEHRRLLALRYGDEPGAGGPIAAGRARPRPGDRDRSRELARREGWAWLRPFRRYDDYRRALDRVHAEHESLGERERETTLV